MNVQEVIDPTRLVIPEGLVADEETLSPTYGRFILQPLERGFGTTLGSALRRVLLSSMEGAALETVRMEGVQHEFSTVEGMVEDVPEVVLNLKEVRLRLADGEPTRSIRVTKPGPGSITAGDLAVDSNIEIVNSEHHIATLSDGAVLDMELTVARGRGYSLADERVEEEMPLGTIVIDATYSPIKRVNFQINPARVGMRTDYDELSLELWTDGTVEPREALVAAAKTIRSHLAFLVSGEDLAGEEFADMGEEQKGETLLSMSIDEMELSVRSANCLKAAGIQDVEELVRKTEADMLKYRNFGRKSLTELTELLTSMGLWFGMTEEMVEAIRHDGIEALADLPPPPQPPEPSEEEGDVNVDEEVPADADADAKGDGEGEESDETPE